MIRLKRIYEPASEADGFRVLVERLWPRGVTKEAARLDLWLKDIAPSPDLRTWYSHDVSKWDEFKERYQLQLKNNPDQVDLLRKVISEHATVTFLFAAKDEQHCSAVILKDFIQQ
jgi:uncharacterized protein YeaO (DUF488 family)